MWYNLKEYQCQNIWITCVYWECWGREGRCCGEGAWCCRRGIGTGCYEGGGAWCYKGWGGVARAG